MKTLLKHKNTIFSYISLSIVLTIGFFILGPLPIFERSSFFEYDQKAFLILTEFWFIIPLLILFNSKYIGNFFLFLFGFLIGLEQFLFYIVDYKSPFNQGMSPLMAENFMKSILNPDQISTNTSFYFSDNMFLFWILAFPIIFFCIFKLLNFLFGLHKHKFNVEIGFFALFLYVTLVISVYTYKQIPFYNRVVHSFSIVLTEKLNQQLLNIERQDIYIESVGEAKAKNIVLIVAESVRGDYLSLNNSNKTITRSSDYLLDLEKEGHLVNYGITYSTSNCSHASNKFLLTGFPKDRFKYYATNPTFFQYMKNAGYKTYQIDSPHNGYYNGRKLYDNEFIDSYISMYKEDKNFRDLRSVDKLEEILKNGSSNFVYMVQQGVHFPVESSYPSSTSLHKNISTNSDFTHKERGFVNNYLNGINWSVNLFWKKLDIIGKKYPNTVFIYTGDHGTHIVPHASETSIKLTHCAPGFSKYESLYNVPTFIYSGDKKILKNYTGNKESTHKSIFPTLLDLAGYNHEEVRSIYGNNLDNFDSSKEDIFMYRLFQKELETYKNVLKEKSKSIDTRYILNKRLTKEVSIEEVNELLD